MATHTTPTADRISAQQRELFAALADEMIPAAGGMPSASEAGAHRSGLEAVLGARPDLVEPLRQALDGLVAAADAGAALALVRSAGHEQAWGVLGMVVPAAYFLNPEVRAALGYPGQEALRVDEQPDDLDLELVAEVTARPPVYRPTPEG